MRHYDVTRVRLRALMRATWRGECANIAHECAAPLFDMIIDAFAFDATYGAAYALFEAAARPCSLLPLLPAHAACYFDDAVYAMMLTPALLRYADDTPLFTYAIADSCLLILMP